MKKKVIICIMSILCMVVKAFPVECSAFAASVIGEASAPIDGHGTKEEPYKYLIDGNSKVTWKHLIENHEKDITEVYEFREGGDLGGNLCYSYTFSGGDILPNASGPYFLEIRFYEGKYVEGLPGYPEAMFFSFSTKRDFPGKTTVIMYVGNRFADGAKLTLTYYGGYDSTVIHGAVPAAAKDEIRQVGTSAVHIAENIIVSEGMASFDVRYGGNYVLHAEPVDFSGFGIGEVIHYDAGKVLGSIRSIFPTEEVAEAVALQLGKETGDTVTQGDIDSIKSLYLSSIGLKSADELERVYFSRLEALTLSGNELESLNRLSMPSLSYLDVSRNALKSVNALAQLNALENIELSGNNLISLPDLNGLDNLQTLDLSDNQLQIIPSLASTKLRHLDLSRNSIIRIAGNLTECTSLESLILSGQAFYTEVYIKEGEDFHMEPEPLFLSSFGYGGTVTLTDSRDRVIYREKLSVLEADGFCLKGDFFERSGRHTVMVDSAVNYDQSGENLGIYTYNVYVGSGQKKGLDLRRFLALLILAVLLGVGAVVGIHARRLKKRNEGFKNEQDRFSKGCY